MVLSSVVTSWCILTHPKYHVISQCISTDYNRMRVTWYQCLYTRSQMSLKLTEANKIYAEHVPTKVDLYGNVSSFPQKMKKSRSRNKHFFAIGRSRQDITTLQGHAICHQAYFHVPCHVGKSRTRLKTIIGFVPLVSEFFLHKDQWLKPTKMFPGSSNLRFAKQVDPHKRLQRHKNKKNIKHLVMTEAF